MSEAPAESLITETAALAGFCERLARANYIALDTEFIREKTYWPRLCLVQVAGPGEAAVIDPLAGGIDLKPLFALLSEPEVLKVLHSARQDIEIFHHLTGEVPHPIFDTQVAAMVCGFGESVAYESLAAKLTGARIDKAVRFTDWSRRPLADNQLRYALDDVIYLRPVYEKLARRLEQSGRAPWLAEEMATLTDPATYRVEPEEAWRRLKPRTTNRRTLAILREVAAWREREARRLDLPRPRLLRDEALQEVAASVSRSESDLERIRGLGRALTDKGLRGGLLGAVKRGLSVPEAACPQPLPRRQIDGNLGALVDLLKVLLKANCSANGVAQRLVATAEDLEAIAAFERPEVLALKGWRHEIFGKDALALKSGRLALAVEPGGIKLVQRPERRRRAPKRRLAARED